MWIHKGPGMRNDIVVQLLYINTLVTLDEVRLDSQLKAIEPVLKLGDVNKGKLAFHPL
tara:strand:- start:7334 stop:7507 length:174 start_codon:yes stop_codon:yes gene_type:complete